MRTRKADANGNGNVANGGKEKVHRQVAEIKDVSVELHDKLDVAGDVSPVGVVRVTEAVRDVKKDIKRRRLYPTVSYRERVSIFERQYAQQDFGGFFNLFWIGLGIFAMTTAMRNWKETGQPLGTSLFDFMSADLLPLLVSDVVMVLATVLSLPFQLFVLHDYVRWEGVAAGLQYVLEFSWFATAVYWPFYMQWSWTHQVFFCLHSITLLMKVHSYGFYNGHLSMVLRQLANDSHGDKRALADEIVSPFGNITYPNNLTLANYIDYLYVPTLCYELEYPRTPHGIRWWFLAEKVAATFSCIFLLYVTSESYIVPPLRHAKAELEKQSEWRMMAFVAAESVGLLMFPFMLAIILVFLIIFEFVLNAFAEITCFADRNFYEDWWNSTNWEEFSRLWNVPVYRFLMRHVYRPARQRVRKPLAIFTTFLLSSLVHELVMACITKKVRGYGLICQMSQIPLTAISKTQFFRDKKTLGNCVFWVSIISGMATINTVYCLW